eukprot:g21570.t2
MGEKLVGLSNGLIGLGSSVRHTQDEQLKAQRQATKSLSDIGWQLSGAGKGVNTSVKESLGKLLTQIDANVGRQGKAQEETNALLKTLNGLMKSLVDVEQRKTTLVAQAAKAASTLRTHPWQGAVCPMAAEAGPAAQAPSAEATRSFKVDPASKDEVEAFIKENNRWIDDAAASELRNMRVISAGTLVSCRDAAGVMRSRVRQAKEKEAILSGSKTEDAATKLSIPASKEEVEAFISANRRWMTPESEEMMKLMNPLDQKRVITGGTEGIWTEKATGTGREVTLSGCRDSVAVLQTRAKRGREMELEFEMIASGKKVEPPKPASEQMPLPLFSAEAARAFIHATPQEVRSEHSRFASAADPESFVTEETSGPLVGQVKGIGGVIEMLRAKYGCSKGQRLRVIGETPALLQFEGGKTAPKNHEGSGWKWVIGSDASSGQKDEVSRQAEMAATLHARDERLAQEAAQKVKDKERRAAEKAALEELVSKELR